MRQVVESPAMAIMPLLYVSFAPVPPSIVSPVSRVRPPGFATISKTRWLGRVALGAQSPPTIVVLSIPAPWIVMSLSVTKTLAVQVAVPAGNWTVSPSPAASSAICTSDCDRLSAVRVVAWTHGPCMKIHAARIAEQPGTWDRARMAKPPTWSIVAESILTPTDRESNRYGGRTRQLAPNGERPRFSNRADACPNAGRTLAFNK